MSIEMQYISQSVKDQMKLDDVHFELQQLGFTIHPNPIGYYKVTAGSDIYFEMRERAQIALAFRGHNASAFFEIISVKREREDFALFDIRGRLYYNNDRRFDIMAEHSFGGEASFPTTEEMMKKLATIAQRSWVAKDMGRTITLTTSDKLLLAAEFSKLGFPNYERIFITANRFSMAFDPMEDKRGKERTVYFEDRDTRKGINFAFTACSDGGPLQLSFIQAYAETNPHELLKETAFYKKDYLLSKSPLPTKDQMEKEVTALIIHQSQAQVTRGSINAKIKQ
jgi:hypothetical protein